MSFVLIIIVSNSDFVMAQSQQPPNWYIFNTANSGLDDNRAYHLMYDSQTGVHWCGTFNGGLSKVVGETINTYSVSNSSIPTNKIRHMTFGPGGMIWMGTRDQGIVTFDTTNLVFTSYNPGNSGMPSVESWGITTDQFGNLWAAAGTAGLVMFDGMNWTVYNTGNSGIPDNWINYVSEDSQGNIWTAGTNGVGRFDGVNWTSYNAGDFSRYVIQASDGRMWFASTTRLSVLDGTNITHFTTANSGVSDNDFSCVVEDQNGNIWAGTVNGGVVMYDGTSFTTFDATNSTLPDNYIETIDISSLNQPWVGMNSGGLAGFVMDTNITTIDSLPILTMPNVFTPNDDGINDSFLPATLDNVVVESFVIYSRWGIKLSETADMTVGWKGTYNGKRCSDGTYFWILNYRDLEATTYKLNGTVTLLR